METREILKNEHLNVLFLVETDVILENGKDSYKTENYQTVVTKHESEKEKVIKTIISMKILFLTFNGHLRSQYE
jgi:hypothetical protein